MATTELHVHIDPDLVAGIVRGRIQPLVDRLDEAEEKIAFLSAGCVRMSRDELIAKITEVGPERWKAGVWISEQRNEAYQRGYAAGRAERQVRGSAS